MTPSRFAELRVVELTAGMGVRAPRACRPTFPRAIAPVRVLNGRTYTRKTASGGGIAIGCAYTPRPPAMSADAELAQAALLEPRTARPLPFLNRVAGALWRWL